MRPILALEIKKERCNAEALGVINSIAQDGSIPTPSEQGFRKAPVSELVNKLNEKSFAGDYKFKEWVKGDMHRIYVNGGDLYKTSKVEQTAYIDAKTGNVSVFTSSNQPMNWNKSQSEEVKQRLEKYGRYIRRFKE